MNRPRFPLFGSPEFDRAYAERFGAPPNYDLISGRRCLGMAGRGPRPEYDSDDEDDGYGAPPRGGRGRRGGQDVPPDDVVERIEWRLDGMRDYFGQGGHGGMGPYGGGNGPRGPGMRPHPGHGGYGGYGGYEGPDGRPRHRRRSSDSSRGGNHPQCPTQ